MPSTTPSVLPPGSTIGILGDGQLGRMLAMAAAQLGYRCHIYGPNAPGVAGAVATHATCADYDDRDGLQACASICDVMSYEFENVPVRALDSVENIPVYPPTMALDIAQDRLSEKKFATAQGGQPAKFLSVNSLSDLDTAISELGLPIVLKTRRMGYDGKGQVRIDSADDAACAWDELGQQPAIAETWLAHDGEFSVLLVRGMNGEILFWDSPENTHVDGILLLSTVPPGPAITPHIDAARALATAMANALNYVGVMTCEFFATAAGPVFNEMAPRVHNSGHWTIEGAVTSQFENHIRAICGLPLGSTVSTGNRIEMHNLIGEDANTWHTLLANPECHVHLYGKLGSTAGRKMGHATQVFRNAA